MSVSAMSPAALPDALPDALADALAALPLAFVRDEGGWICPLWGETPQGRRFRATLRIELAPGEQPLPVDPGSFLGMHI